MLRCAHRSVSQLLACLILVCITHITHAAGLPDGEKTISLFDNNGEELVIGKMSLSNQGDNTTYTIVLNDSEFNDEFLSMRPFQCIHSPDGKMVCHLIYPYQKQGYITASDLMDLEYDFLFLHKSQEEYGINAWNGLYYKLTPTEKGFEGQLMEVDLNVLAAPPDDGVLRPITSDMLHQADPSVHMFPKLLIQ